ETELALLFSVLAMSITFSQSTSYAFSRYATSFSVHAFLFPLREWIGSVHALSRLQSRLATLLFSCTYLIPFAYAFSHSHFGYFLELIIFILHPTFLHKRCFYF